jgi:phenylalanine-4-hydroxylase
MEFQAYNVLVIASDMRTLKDIEYTPVPDIIHESAGHAPIIANPEYSEFLRRLGQIGCRAISTSKDEDLHYAVRILTDLKTSQKSTPETISVAEQKVKLLQDQQEISEMTAIRNLHWWSVEYGLIGSMDHFKIYGAGLLSSIGESKWCRTDEVKKIPYSIEAAWQNFDYTKPQPQLFVTPDFAHLSLVVEEYANKMALRRGGLDALQKLIDSKKMGTIELSTGIQVTGLFSKVFTADRDKVAYFSTVGETALAYREKELIGHGTLNHPSGFGSPVGKLKGINLAIEDMYPRDLEAYDIYEGRQVKLEFEGGVTVEGIVITGVRNLQGKILMIRFKNCLVRHRDEILFTPDEGIYSMAVGKEVVSGFAGPADLDSFNLISHEINEEQPMAKIPQTKELEAAYQQVRSLRQSTALNSQDFTILDQLAAKYPKEWLLLLECREVSSRSQDSSIKIRLTDHLNELAHRQPEIAHLIAEGLGFK